MDRGHLLPSFPWLKFLRDLWIAEVVFIKVKQVQAQAVFHSHSPKSCKYGCQCRYWARSSATCPDKRICPASLQSSTRCATLIPDPPMFVLSLTSVTQLTGPL